MKRLKKKLVEIIILVFLQTLLFGDQAPSHSKCTRVATKHGDQIVDCNRDGKPDVIVASAFGASHQIAITRLSPAIVKFINKQARRAGMKRQQK